MITPQNRASMGNQSNASRRVVGDGITIMSQETLHGTVISAIPQGERPQEEAETTTWPEPTYNSSTDDYTWSIPLSYVTVYDIPPAGGRRVLAVPAVSWTITQPSGPSISTYYLFIDATAFNSPVFKWSTTGDSTGTGQVDTIIPYDGFLRVGTWQINPGFNSVSAILDEKPVASVDAHGQSPYLTRIVGTNVSMEGIYEFGAGLSSLSVSLPSATGTYDVYMYFDTSANTWELGYAGGSPNPLSFGSRIKVAEVDVVSGAVVGMYRETPAFFFPPPGLSQVISFPDNNGTTQNLTFVRGILTAYSTS